MPMLIRDPRNDFGKEHDPFGLHLPHTLAGSVRHRRIPYAGSDIQNCAVAMLDRHRVLPRRARVFLRIPSGLLPQRQTSGRERQPLAQIPSSR